MEYKDSVKYRCTEGKDESGRLGTACLIIPNKKKMYKLIIYFIISPCFRFDGRPVEGPGAGERHWSDDPPAGFAKGKSCYNQHRASIFTIFTPEIGNAVTTVTCRAEILANFVAAAVT